MEDRIIKASEGKVFRRISDGFIFGKEIHLGYMHYIGGKYDTLVPPKDVKRHVQYIQEKHPELATFKVFDTAGHLQFTIGLNHDSIDYIVKLLNEETPVVPFTTTDTLLHIGYTKCDPNGNSYSK